MPRTLLCLLPLALAAWPAPSAAQTDQDFFDPTVLHEIRMWVHPADWARLKAHYLENTYYPAEFEWRNLAAYDVGIRSRGLGTRNSIKPGLRVDINRYARDRQFLGQTSFILDNAKQDASFVRERLSFLMFQRWGFVVPREAFTRLYVNGRYAGLYVIVEDPDKPFLRRNFGEDTGYLYEYKYWDEYRFEYLGNHLDRYLLRFKPVTHESDPEIPVIQEMIRTINEAPDQEFVTRISPYLDPRAMVTYLAVENFIAEWDGIVGYAGMNNYYLYRPANQKRFTFIPWDKDVTFASLDHSIDYNHNTNVLVRRLMAVPELRRAYLETLRAIALDAGGEGGWLDQEAEKIYWMIRSSVYEDTTEEYTRDAFEGQSGLVRDFIRIRAAQVLSMLEQAR